MRVTRIRVGTTAALCALVAGIVFAPAAALGQSSAVDQYVPNPPPGGGEAPESGGGVGNPNNPGGGEGPTGGGGGENPAGAEGPAAGGAGPALAPSAGTGETDAGELPFTGYPVTALLLIVLLLLVGGLLVRFGPAGFDRIRGAYGSR